MRASLTVAVALTIAHPSAAAQRSRRAAGTLPAFNALVIETISTYSVEGGYVWPARRGTHGTTRDLWLATRRRPTRVARAGRGTHCVGVTFEIFWRALERWPGGPAAAGLSASSSRRLRRLWFVPIEGGMGAAEALPSLRLGRRITSFEEARAGDFVQVWSDGWGHSAVFLGWIRADDGTVTGMRYWSSQPWTDGMGESELAIGSAPGQVRPELVFLARAEPHRLRAVD